jgi:U3 small nucleolar RNA-associated protein MPP10
MGSDEELELGSDEEGLLDEEEDDDEEDGDDVDDEGSDGQAEDDEDDGYAPGPSKPRAKHPTLDDTFFSIDDFNRQTEELEAGRVTSGALGGDEDEDAELDDVGAMFLEEGEEDDAPLMYSDFFAPPPRPAPTPEMGKGKSKGKAKDDGKKKSKRKVAFAEEDEDEAEPEEAEDPSRGIMDRVKADLFDDSEDEGDVKEGESLQLSALSHGADIQSSPRTSGDSASWRSRLRSSRPRPSGPRTGRCSVRRRRVRAPRTRCWRRTWTLSMSPRSSRP